MALVVVFLVCAFVAVSLAPPRARLALWVVVILGCVIPWVGFQDHPHWTRINWIPFNPTFRRRDIALNVALYVPIGLFWPRATGNWLRVVATCGVAAAALSIGTEATQIYSHGRFPSITDVITNTFGALAGAAIAPWLRVGVWRPESRSAGRAAPDAS